MTRVTIDLEDLLGVLTPEPDVAYLANVFVQALRQAPTEVLRHIEALDQQDRKWVDQVLGFAREINLDLPEDAWAWLCAILTPGTTS